MVDDDDTTNFLNKFFLSQVDSSLEINVVTNGKEALEFLALNGKEDLESFYFPIYKTYNLLIILLKDYSKKKFILYVLNKDKTWIILMKKWKI